MKTKGVPENHPHPERIRVPNTTWCAWNVGTATKWQNCGRRGVMVSRGQAYCDVHRPDATREARPEVETVTDQDGCNCEFDPDPDDPEPSTHFKRTCAHCGAVWWGLHCPHDGYQNPCPDCGVIP